MNSPNANPKDLAAVSTPSFKSENPQVKTVDSKAKENPPGKKWVVDGQGIEKLVDDLPAKQTLPENCPKADLEKVGINNLIPAKAPTLEAHPLAEMVPGRMSEKEFNALCLDIAANGLQVDIMLYQGKILDGRERYKACMHLGIGCRSWDSAINDKQALDNVISRNLHRRTLNSCQKALVGARMTLADGATLSQDAAAESVGVGVATLNACVKLLNSKNANLIKQVENGKMTRLQLNEELYTCTHPDLKPSGGGSGQIAGDLMDPDKTKARETPASKLLTQFRALDKANQKSFVEMSEPFILPIMQTIHPKVVPTKQTEEERKANRRIRDKSRREKQMKAKKNPAMVKPAPKKKAPPKKKAINKPKPARKPVIKKVVKRAKPKIKKQVIGFKDLKKRGQTLIKARGPSAFRKILGQYKISKLSELTKPRYPAFLVHLNRAIAA